MPSGELSEQIPDSLQYCASLQVLDLSDNRISGTIPSQIFAWLPYLTTLDLSGNQLSGSIPPNLGDCAYLNRLRLSSNRLSGQIPYKLASLPRLTDFTVANNDLYAWRPAISLQPIYHRSIIRVETHLILLITLISLLGRKVFLP